MLAKKFRLPGHSIPKVLSKGKILQLPLFTVKFLRFPTNHLADNSLFTFIVSPKVNKKAVVRNLLKRRLSQALWKNLSAFKPKMQIIILAKKEILKAGYRQIEQEMKLAVGLLNNKTMKQ